MSSYTDRDRKRSRESSPSASFDYKRNKANDDRLRAPADAPYEANSTSGGYYGGGNASSYGGSSRSDSRYGGHHSNGSTTAHAPRLDDDPIYQSYSGVGGYVVRDFTDEATLFSRPNTGINFDKYDSIKIEIEGRGAPEPLNSFDEAKLHPQLLVNIRLAKYDKPTPVQKYSLPIILQGRDLMASAQTGSGKTGGFLFPIVDGLLKAGVGGYRPSYGRPSLPYAVILAPTRELVIQIYQEAQKFVYRTSLRAVCVYGGTSKSKQCREVERGVDIIIATCGRLQDLCDLRKVSFQQVRFLCLDEADRMLDMGFEPQIRSLVEKLDMPSVRERRTMMFSATFPRPIQKMAADFLDQYLFLKVGTVGSTSENITQRIKWVEEHDKENAIIAELRAITGRTLIFVETRRKADWLSRFLQSQGFNTLPIHGDLKQHEREYALEDFKVGRCNVLAATEVAARGLDIENVEHVVNYDLPNNIDDYVHRIGRTGRAGNTGLATAFYNSRNSVIANDLFDRLKEAKQEIPEWLEKERHAKHSNQNRGGGGRRGASNPRSRSTGYGGGRSYGGGGYNSGPYGGGTDRYSGGLHSGNGHATGGSSAAPYGGSVPYNGGSSSYNAGPHYGGHGPSLGGVAPYGNSGGGGQSYPPSTYSSGGGSKYGPSHGGYVYPPPSTSAYSSGYPSK